jgi:hypothetical protein
MPSAADSMSIIFWLLAIMARESSEGISPTVRTCWDRAGRARAVTAAAAVPASTFLRFIMRLVSGCIECNELEGPADSADA